MALDPSEMKGRKLGRVLTKLGKVTRDQVHEALAIQQTRKVKLGQLLVELNYCTERDVLAALAGQAGMSFESLDGFDIPEDIRDVIPAESVRSYEVIPLEYNKTSRRIKIAMKTPDNFRAVDDLRLLLGGNVDAVVGDPAAIDALIKKYFSKQESITDVVSELASDERVTNMGARGADS
ncbi:MAG: hypothetical protein ACK58T_23675, partial [Phycisphaerae bacterium]